jgi:phosphoribosylanthranilate isomerase
MIVKICGVARLEDGLAALDAGADMLGFNFHPPSPRYVAPEDCAGMVAALRRAAPFTAVGVFVNTPASEVAAALDACGLDLAQLSGDEPPEALHALGDRAFKAIRAADEADRFAVPSTAVRPALLLDAQAGAAYGGTGRTADWGLAHALAGRYNLLLAGGLRPENVADAVRQARPWGVDVASGVESAPGRKDAALMRAFIVAARDAASETA